MGIGLDPRCACMKAANHGFTARVRTSRYRTCEQGGEGGNVHVAAVPSSGRDRKTGKLHMCRWIY